MGFVSYVRQTTKFGAVYVLRMNSCNRVAFGHYTTIKSWIFVNSNHTHIQDITYERPHIDILYANYKIILIVNNQLIKMINQINSRLYHP